MKGEGSVCGTCLLSGLAQGTCLGVDHLFHFEISSSWCSWEYERVQEMDSGLVFPPVLDGKLRKVFLSQSWKNLTLPPLNYLMFHFIGIKTKTTTITTNTSMLTEAWEYSQNENRFPKVNLRTYLWDSMRCLEALSQQPIGTTQRMPVWRRRSCKSVWKVWGH